VVAVLMMTWGVISSAMIFVTTPRSFYVLRFCWEQRSGFFPGGDSVLEELVPASARARTVARFMTGGALSGVWVDRCQDIAEPTSPVGAGGVQWLFLIEGVPAIFLGGVVLAYLTDRPRKPAGCQGGTRLAA